MEPWQVNNLFLDKGVHLRAIKDDGNAKIKPEHREYDCRKASIHVCKIRGLVDI